MYVEPAEQPNTAASPLSAAPAPSPAPSRELEEGEIDEDEEEEGDSEEPPRHWTGEEYWIPTARHGKTASAYQVG